MSSYFKHTTDITNTESTTLKIKTTQIKEIEDFSQDEFELSFQ